MDLRGLILLVVAGLGLWLINVIFSLGIGVWGFFLALALAIAWRRILAMILPIILPRHKLRVWALGWTGGFVGSLIGGGLWPSGLEIAGLHLIGALSGGLLFILAAGLWPFLKILVGNG